MRDYTKIVAWKLADELAVAVYQVTKFFPREEVYGLTSQIRRAAVSVPTNIVEGSARPTNPDYLHFLSIARASLTEAQYLVRLATRLGYLSEADSQLIIQQTKRTFGCLNGLIKAVQSEAT